MKRGKLLFIVGVIVAGAAVLAILRSQLRSDTPEPASERVLPFVTTVAPIAHEGRVTIRGNGTVRPLREVTLISELQGRSPGWQMNLSPVVPSVRDKRF